MVFEYRDSSAVAALNSYVWKLLEANLGWDVDDYSGAKPIIPVNQQPEMMQSGKPFVVYGSAALPTGHLYELQSESIAYKIFATSTVEANKIANLLVEAFKRQDDAAADVNEWIDTEGEPGKRPTKRTVHFGSIKMSMTEMAEPADEEGGFYSSFVLVSVLYTAENDTVQLSGFTYP